MQFPLKFLGNVLQSGIQQSWREVGRMWNRLLFLTVHEYVCSIIRGAFILQFAILHQFAVLLFKFAVSVICFQDSPEKEKTL